MLYLYIVIMLKCVLHTAHVHLETKTLTSKAVKPCAQNLLILEGWGDKTLLWECSLSSLMSQETGAAALCALLIWTAEFPRSGLMSQYKDPSVTDYREELMRGWWRLKTQSRANTLLWHPNTLQNQGVSSNAGISSFCFHTFSTSSCQDDVLFYVCLFWHSRVMLTFGWREASHVESIDKNLEQQW